MGEAMLTIRPIKAQDRDLITCWPAYPEEFRGLDYALRSGGWLDEYGQKENAKIYAIEESGDLVGFTLLSDVSIPSPEFRIALRADRLGRGDGEEIVRLTLSEGFSSFPLTGVHLLVRKKNVRAYRLYIRVGFRVVGETVLDVRGEKTDFWLMEIGREDFLPSRSVLPGESFFGQGSGVTPAPETLTRKEGG